MFQCTACQSSEFQLMLQPGQQGKVEARTNEHQELVLIVNQKEFIADLLFMNQFALCKACGGMKTWQYFFPKQKMAM
jgi:hypothetical protein